MYEAQDFALVVEINAITFSNPASREMEPRQHRNHSYATPATNGRLSISVEVHRARVRESASATMPRFEVTNSNFLVLKSRLQNGYYVFSDCASFSRGNHTMRTLIVMALSIMSLEASGIRPTEPMEQSINDHTALTVQEAEPLLQIISRLGHVVVVKSSPNLLITWPHICWITDPKIDAVNSALWKFKGKSFWYVLSDMPRTCLVAEVSETVASETTPQPQMAERLRTIAVAEIPNLSEFLADTLSLTHKQSLGYEVSNRDLELPLVKDRVGSGRPVAIVGDPEKYARQEGIPTSDLDRTIHFWITESDYDQLFAVLEEGDASSSRKQRYPLLWRIVSGSYQSVAIRPGEIQQLITECQRLKFEVSHGLSDALSNIQSVGGSASNYKLGICIPGG
jgi:hypothetical protein